MYNPCPTGCSFELPKITNPACSVFNDELITELRFSYPDKPLSTPTPIVGDANYAAQLTARAQEWATRLDNLANKAAKPNAIRFLGVNDGVMPASDTVTKTTASGQTIAARKTPTTITFVVDDDSDEMYEFIKTLTDCPKQFLIWFVSGGHVYGGKDGVLATITASYKIDDTGVAHSWSVTVSFNRRGGLLRDALSI